MAGARVFVQFEPSSRRVHPMVAASGTCNLTRKVTTQMLVCQLVFVVDHDNFRANNLGASLLRNCRYLSVITAKR